MRHPYADIDRYFEACSCDTINELFAPSSYRCKPNNIHHHDIDLKITKDAHRLCTIDVQYSLDFRRYGDVRIDLMSAGFLRHHHHTPVSVLNRMIAQSDDHLDTFKSLFTINKYGKYFDKSHAHDLLGVLYYFYENTFEKRLDNFINTPCDFMFFLPKRIVINEIKTNPKLTIKINDKKSNHIHEAHHSAFACLSIDTLMTKYDLPKYTHRQALYDDLYPRLLNEMELLHA